MWPQDVSASPSPHCPRLHRPRGCNCSGNGLCLRDFQRTTRFLAELDYLQVSDDARHRVQTVVDLPDRRLNLIHKSLPAKPRTPGKGKARRVRRSQGQGDRRYGSRRAGSPESRCRSWRLMRLSRLANAQSRVYRAFDARGGNGDDAQWGSVGDFQTRRRLRT